MVGWDSVTSTFGVAVGREVGVGIPTSGIVGIEVGTSVTKATGSLVDKTQVSLSIGKKNPNAPTPITATQRQMTEIETAIIIRLRLEFSIINL